MHFYWCLEKEKIKNDVRNSNTDDFFLKNCLFIFPDDKLSELIFGDVNKLC